MRRWSDLLCRFDSENVGGHFKVRRSHVHVRPVDNDCFVAISVQFCDLLVSSKACDVRHHFVQWRDLVDLPKGLRVASPVSEIVCECAGREQGCYLHGGKVVVRDAHFCDFLLCRDDKDRCKRFQL